MSDISDNSVPIAIIGYAYRAPGVGRKGLWEFLAQAKSAWSRVPVERFYQDAFQHPNAEKAGFISSRGGHFLPDDVYAFDAPFFNLKADEARVMDPQHRLLLECALEATESAGLTLKDLAGSRTAVFTGNDTSDYQIQMFEDLHTSNRYSAIGTAACMFANRLSYFFDLLGPSIALDGACASSSYALHLACQNLRSGECNAAIVGAGKLIVSPVTWSALDTMGALSPEGKCFSYDAKASGFGRGECAATLVIKRLSDAVHAGDPIRAVIHNSAGGHSGRSQGITMPSRLAQEELLQRVHIDIGFNPNETTFVEGHGTGTPVGDPIEASAFASIMADDRSSPLYIGSASKPAERMLSIVDRHLEGASGLLAVVKAVMMIERKCLLPNALFEKMNPKIEGREKLRVPQKAIPWPSGAKKRICVTNFGFGGSNAAVIIGEASSKPRQRSRNSTNGDMVTSRGTTKSGNGISGGTLIIQNPNVSSGHPKGIGIVTIDNADQTRLFVFSAKSATSLKSYLSSFAQYLEGIPSSNETMRDMSFTLGQCRTHFGHRVAVAADSVISLKDQLSSLSPGSRSSSSTDLAIAFAFTGQGAQYAGMAAGLRHFESFAAAISDAEEDLKRLGSTWSLAEELARPEHETCVNDAEISQPACTAVQLAIVVLLRAWGITPTVVTGHSSGEIAAAFAAGFVSFRSAIAIAYFRGVAAKRVLQDKTVQGAMLALGTTAEEARKLFPPEREGYATIAATNGPESVTISGDLSAIEGIEQRAESRGLFARRLKVGVAYHSRHMERIAASYLASISPFFGKGCHNSDLAPFAATTFISSVTGRKEVATRIDASYWVENLLSPVQYGDAIKMLLSTDKDDTDANLPMMRRPDVVVEIGPHPALQGPTKQLLGQSHNTTPVAYLPSLVRNTQAETALLRLAGNLFTMGLDLPMAEINQTDRTKDNVVTDLPPYEWNKTRLVHMPRSMLQKLYHGQPYNSLLGWKSPYSEGKDHTYRNVFTLDELPWLRDHKMTGDVLFPFTGFLSLAVEALRAVTPSQFPSINVREFHVNRGLKIEEDQSVDITTRLRPAETGTQASSSSTWAFEIMSWSEDSAWTSHCSGLVEADPGEVSTDTPTMQNATKVLENPPVKELDIRSEYALGDQSGASYGPAFRKMVRLRQGSDTIVHDIEIGRLDLHSASETSGVTVDPPTLDTFLHGHGAIRESDGPRPSTVPNHCPRFRISNRIPSGAGQMFTIVSRRLDLDEKSGDLRFSIAVFAELQDSSAARIPVAEFDALTMKCVAQPRAEDLAQSLPDAFYLGLKPHENIVYGNHPTNGTEEPDLPQDMKSIAVCASFTDGDGKVFANQISEQVTRAVHCASPIQHFRDLNPAASQICIFVDSPAKSMIKDLTSNDFDILKKLLLELKGLLWVTPENAAPEANIMKGILRTLRQEDSSRPLLLLEGLSYTAAGVSAVARLAERLCNTDQAMLQEQEFVWADGLVHVPRLLPLEAAKETFAQEAGMPIKKEESIGHSSDGLEMTVETIGSPDSIYFQRNSIMADELKDDEIIVQVEAAGMNFRDLLLVLGSMKWHNPGLEGAGTVIRTGNAVEALRPGDRVCYLSNQAGFSNYVRARAVYAAIIPQNVSSVEAATLPIAYTTAFYCLIRVGRLAKGETVLIHAASGAVGQACITVAQHLGARVFATAGTPEKRDFLHNTFGIPKTRIFSSRNAEFRDRILCATDGGGVDVVVNSLSGHLLQMTWDLVAECGRFVEIGKKDALQNSHLGMKTFDRNVSFTSVDLRKIFSQRPEEARDLLAKITSMLQEQTIASIRPINVIPISQIASGLRKLQSGHNIGKIVVTVDSPDLILAECAPRLGKPSEKHLRSDATYLISGGTGGLGRSLASWMFENGAENVVLLGRSGASHPEVAKLLKRYEGSKNRLRAVVCDVGSRADLSHALETLQELPKVRGVIHAAMYLRDAIFSNSSFDDWKMITAPKIQGAWNLHELVPDLDFFVSLASMTGVGGHVGQSIYGGTSTFLDAFTSYRLNQGLPAVSISLPAIEGVGYAADQGLIEHLQQSLGLYLPAGKVFTLVKAGIIGQSSGVVHADGRIISFMPRPAISSEVPWERSNMFEGIRRTPDDIAEAGALRGAQGYETSEALVEALSLKVSAITMMDREEISPERSLLDYGLDSLVSVELRSWIRREVGVDMALNQIVGAAHLKALADLILAQK